MGRGERDPQGGLCPKKLPSVKTTAPATIPCTNTSPRHPVFIAPTPSSGVPHDLEMIHLLLLSRSATIGKYYSYVTATKIWSFAMTWDPHDASIPLAFRKPLRPRGAKQAREKKILTVG